jgi:hypothetical protein
MCSQTGHDGRQEGKQSSKDVVGAIKTGECGANPQIYYLTDLHLGIYCKAEGVSWAVDGSSGSCNTNRKVTSSY